MTVDAFLKLEGVKGESSDSKHAGAIDVLSWSWALAQGASSHSGGGGGSGRVEARDLLLTKHVDRATPVL